MRRDVLYKSAELVLVSTAVSVRRMAPRKFSVFRSSIPRWSGELEATEGELVKRICLAVFAKTAGQVRAVSGTSTSAKSEMGSARTNAATLLAVTSVAVHRVGYC